MRSGKTHYTHAMGLLELREEICAYYHREYGVTITPDQVLVTSGTSPAMLLMMIALLEQGDEVILSNPHYACYLNFIRTAGGIPVEVRTRPGGGFPVSPGGSPEVADGQDPRHPHQLPFESHGIVMTDQNLKDMAAFSDRFHRLRRNLSRPCLRGEGAFHPGIYGPGLRHQRIFQSSSP